LAEISFAKWSLLTTELFSCKEILWTLMKILLLIFQKGEM
jgi:hypothetical protein